MSPVNSGRTNAPSRSVGGMGSLCVNINIMSLEKNTSPRNPDIDDTKPIKNPDRLIVMEEEWLKRETYAQDASLARLSLPIPEVPRPWVAPPEARTRDCSSTTASSSGASTPLLDERSILSTPKGFNRASLHLTSEEASMSAPQSSGFVSSVPPQVNASEESSQHPCPLPLLVP